MSRFQGGPVWTPDLDSSIGRAGAYSHRYAHGYPSPGHAPYDQQGLGSAVWLRDHRPPTPPRAPGVQASEMPAAGPSGASEYFPRRTPGTSSAAPLQWPSYQVTGARGALDARDPRGIQDMHSTRPVQYMQQPQVVEAPSSKSSRAAVRCDKCDEAHETASCPYFKKSREDHADAWVNLTSTSASSPSRPSRVCNAPKTLYGYETQVVQMPGDGTCLFHSVAYGLRNLGFSEDGHNIRQRVARFISENPECEISGTPLRSWVEWDSQATVAAYAQRISAGNQWGGGIEMAACAKIFSVDVVVYERDRDWNFRRISDFLADSSKPRGSVLLLYSGRAHYDSLVFTGTGGGYSRDGGYRGTDAEDYNSNRDVTEEDDDFGCSLM
eukprot:gnl/TRDRNA2_/TRDRNA2_194048_c0_seq1.p1 gnl/TRDRNA2_/TRDRNA2_194048_c0~~gnl/TRDRNA2_/TRDRNA2_194048_c0_seq1.p1  ORF type:complete len:397 (-),score=31.94 gnl/TRDRNA2_/TRDRNA2_194048_c0_seq1:109-1254(-)